MNDHRVSLKQFKIGLTVFAGIVIFIIMMFVVGSESNTFTPTYTIRLFLPNISGLADGSMVSLGGLKIGNVTKMDFGERDGRQGVIITVKIRTVYQPQITAGSVASVKTIGMLGDKFVDISIGTAADPPLRDGDFITVKPTVELSDVMEQFTGVISDVAATASNAHAISDAIRHGRGAAGRLLCDDTAAGELADIISNLRRASTALTARNNTLGRLMQDDALYATLDRTAANLSSLSDSLRAGRGTAGRLLTSDTLYDALRSISRRMDAVLAKMGSDSSSVGPLLNSTASLQQLSALVTNINALVADIKEHPKKYVHLSIF